MSEPKTVWAASSGSYSDYGVSSIFERQEDAEAYVAEMNVDKGYGPDYYVEDFTYYPAGTRPTVTLIWAVYAHDSGSVTVESYATDEADAPRRYARPVATEETVGGRMYFRASCIDKEAAIKAVADRQTRWQARHAGL